MKIYNRYIIKELGKDYFFILLTLTGIIWLSQSLRYIALIIDSGINITEFVKLALLMFPSLLIGVLPIASFIITTHIYYKLIVEHELTALMNTGLSKFSLSRAALGISVIATLFNYFLSLYILPISYQEFKSKLLHYRDHYVSIMIEDKVFNNRIKNITIYVEERQIDGNLTGIFIYDERNPSKPITIMAEKGEFSKTKYGTKLALYKGNRQEINENGQLDILYFEYFIYGLDLETTGSSTRAKDMQELFINELLYPQDNNTVTQNKLKAEGHRRLSWPLYNIILTIGGLLAVYSKTFDRKGQSKRIAAYALIAILIIIASFAINNLISQMTIFAPLSYIYPISLVMIGLYLLISPTTIHTHKI